MRPVEGRPSAPPGALRFALPASRAASCPLRSQRPRPIHAALYIMGCYGSHEGCHNDHYVEFGRGRAVVYFFILLRLARAPAPFPPFARVLRSCFQGGLAPQSLLPLRLARFSRSPATCPLGGGLDCAFARSPSAAEGFQPALFAALPRSCCSCYAPATSVGAGRALRAKLRTPPTHPILLRKICALHARSHAGFSSSFPALLRRSQKLPP